MQEILQPPFELENTTPSRSIPVTASTPNRERSARLIATTDAAIRLGVSATTLRKWANEGLIPVYRTPGGQRRFDADDLERFLGSMRER